MTSVDTNISNYTVAELMAIIEVNDIDPEEIVQNTTALINKFKVSNPQLSVFFMEVQSQLLQYSQGLLDEREEDLSGKIVVEGFGNMSNEAIYPLGDNQVSNWYENEYITQSDQNQVNKITNRQQKIGVFGNEHAPMNRQQIATTDNFQLPVKQDSLNPNLKNTINRFVNLDSQFRQYTSGADSNSTDYTLDLSDTLKDTLSMRVYSYQIPYSWYAVDVNYGNTCLWVIDNRIIMLQMYQ
jgi:predicted metalloenzyme YecM